MKTALVLSGGGARGAYEVGVLAHLYEQIRPVFDLISGTSVGAINGAYLASYIDTADGGIDELVRLWREISLPKVLGFNPLQAGRMTRVLFGGRKGAGIFDATPMTEILRKGIDYRRLARNVRRGPLTAVTITATHVPTGHSTCFVAQRPGEPPLRGLPSAVTVQRANLMPHHVLASAAIPVVFPPVVIGTDLYCDGGLRLNTPLSPAIHLGANRVLVIGLSSGMEAREEIPRGRYPGLPFLLGKVLNAFMLDHVVNDLEELERVNDLLRDGMEEFGPDFVDRLNARAEARGAPPKGIVEALAIRPSQDIGRLAAEFLKRERASLQGQLGRTLLRLLDVGAGSGSADLASYLLFDGRFAAELIALGRADAEARHDELEAFLRAS